MTGDCPDRLKARAECALGDPRFDFIATYHAVNDLRRLERHHPGSLDAATLTALAELLKSRAYDGYRQAYVLFREAASVMTDMAVSAGNPQLGTAALMALQDLLGTTGGNAHRGVAEALGSLPVHVSGPCMRTGNHPRPSSATWHQLVSRSGMSRVGSPRYIGRSLVVRSSTPPRCLVVKLAKATDSLPDLEKESGWMEFLKRPEYAVGCRFHIPAPLQVNGRFLFRIRGLPLKPPSSLDRHPQNMAVAFTAHPDYFVYPNQPGIDGKTAREALGRNAYLLGWLAGRGVIHAAPIPLFHNRTQRLRRIDQGRYQWFRAGRLDQWLDSCAFPNLGLSGIRDFEHLEPFYGDSRALYRHIGTHLLSLLLVAGSHFRSRDASRRGVAPDGSPVDTRDLFDPPLLKAMIGDIFANYYLGFARSPAPDRFPVDLDRLTRRMIEEMSLDRHMIELFRRVDQNPLSDDEFMSFLMQKGYNPATVSDVKKGVTDMHFHSGPHLGDFNRKISLPELIESVAAGAAVCMAGRFAAETGDGAER
jgi:hypothetical protein